MHSMLINCRGIPALPASAGKRVEIDFAERKATAANPPEQVASKALIHFTLRSFAQFKRVEPLRYIRYQGDAPDDWMVFSKTESAELRAMLQNHLKRHVVPRDLWEVVQQLSR